MIGLFGWFWIIYFSVGLFIMFEAMVIAWDSGEQVWWIKVIGSTIALAAWPLIYFM